MKRYADSSFFYQNSYHYPIGQVDDTGYQEMLDAALVFNSMDNSILFVYHAPFEIDL